MLLTKKSYTNVDSIKKVFNTDCGKLLLEIIIYFIKFFYT